MKENANKGNIKPRIFDVAVIGYIFMMLIVAVTQPTEDQLLNLGQNVLMALGCFAVALIFVLILEKSNVKTLGRLIFEPAYKKAQGQKKGMLRSFWGMQLIVFFLITLVASLIVTEFSFYELSSQKGFEGAKRIFSAMFTPNLSILPQGVLAIIQTIFMAFLATAIAVPISFVLSFLCASNIMNKSATGMVIYTALRIVMNVTRSIEPLIWAIIFSVWVGIGPFAGMLALMIHTVASLTKQYSEQIECVEDGPVEGIQSTGANALQVIWFAIVPQIVLPFISFTIFRWDINVRMATIIGLVGGGGIGTMLMNYQGQALWHEVGTLGLLIIAVVWAMDVASAQIREALK